MSIKLMIKELSRRIKYPELRVRLFMQSEYRSVSIYDSTTLLEDLTSGFPAYYKNKEDPDVLVAPLPYFLDPISGKGGSPINLDMLPLSLMMNNLSHYSLQERAYLCTLLDDYQSDLHDCLFADVPHLNDTISPTDDYRGNSLPVAFVTSFVSAAAVVADWQNRTMFPVAFEEDTFEKPIAALYYEDSEYDDTNECDDAFYLSDM